MRIFFVLLFASMSIFIESQEQRLSLLQILDSAKQKHPEILKNTYKANALKNSQTNFKFSPLEVTYKKGNLYGPATDYSLEFRQNFGSPFTLKSGSALNRSELAYTEATAELEEKQVFSEIKKAYFKCQYFIELKRLLEHEFNYYLNFYNDYLDSDSLSAHTFDKLMISGALAAADIENKTIYNQIIKAQNELLSVSFLAIETLPVDTVFEIYEITAPTDKESRTPAHLFNNVYDKKRLIAENSYKLSKAKLAPGIFAGYEMNSFNNKAGYSYWTVGVSVPLLAFSQAASIKQSKMQLEISKMEQLETRSKNDAITTNLLTDMNLYFERINYYYDINQELSDEMLTVAKDTSFSAQSNFEKKLWAVKKAFEIKKTYLQDVLNYNLSAAELELYAY